MKQYFRILSIAGSEPLGSAGLQADIKAISACGGYAAAAVTCIVDEDTTRVKSIFPLPTPFVIDQIRSFLDDVGADAIKIGMLHSTRLIREVARILTGYGIRNIVVDPVMVTSAGNRIIEPDAIGALQEYLVPLARIMTPNLREALLLLSPDSPITVSDWEKPIRALAQPGLSVIVKSIPNGETGLEDLFYDAGSEMITSFSKKKVETRNVNGTGCSFSSAIATFLARGFDLPEAVYRAEEYIDRAIRSGAEYRFGTGFGPVNHFYQFSRE